jgi:hypothetical protein
MSSAIQSRVSVFRKILATTVVLVVPGTSMAEAICEGLSPQSELECLQLYLDEYDPDNQGFDISNALSGTWYNPDRDGEGFMIDVANAGNIAISFYTYDNNANQMWMIGTGDVDGSVAMIDFYITDGAMYGSNFVPESVERYAWGTGVFTFTDCATGTVELTPNQEFSVEFEELVTNITRLTVPVNCSD